MNGRILTCVYCGHEYPQGTLAAGSEVLTGHIKVCERQPVRKAEADIAVLRSALVGLIGADSEQKLRQMEAILRLLPAPESDKAIWINALHALLATRPAEAGAQETDSIHAALAIEKVKGAVSKNNEMQGGTEVGSAEWHAHETIDDLLFDALAALWD